MSPGSLQNCFLCFRVALLWISLIKQRLVQVSSCEEEAKAALPSTEDLRSMAASVLGESLDFCRTLLFHLESGDCGVQLAETDRWPFSARLETTKPA